MKQNKGMGREFHLVRRMCLIKILNSNEKPSNSKYKVTRKGYLLITYFSYCSMDQTCMDMMVTLVSEEESRNKKLVISFIFLNFKSEGTAEKDKILIMINYVINF